MISMVKLKLIISLLLVLLGIVMLVKDSSFDIEMYLKIIRDLEIPISFYRYQ